MWKIFNQKLLLFIQKVTSQSKKLLNNLSRNYRFFKLLHVFHLNHIIGLTYKITIKGSNNIKTSSQNNWNHVIMSVRKVSVYWFYHLCQWKCMKWGWKQALVNLFVNISNISFSYLIYYIHLRKSYKKYLERI